MLNVFQEDSDYLANEDKYKEIKAGESTMLAFTFNFIFNFQFLEKREGSLGTKLHVHVFGLVFLHTEILGEGSSGSEESSGDESDEEDSEGDYIVYYVG